MLPSLSKYKVGRVESSQQAKSRGATSVIKRKLVQVLTPATTSEGSMGAVHLLAIKELGCNVPCEACSLSVAHTIFTRLGSTDRIMTGESTFLIECTETASVPQTAEHNSLVLLDELGRGTSTFHGYAIAHAVFRLLVEIVNCRLLFATHYHPPTKEFGSHPRVKLQHMARSFESMSNSSSLAEKKIVFLYQLVIYDVQLIIQCEPPRDVDDYIHRSGKTRRAGKSGVAVMLYDPRKRNFSRIERESGVKFELVFAPQPAHIAEAAVEKIIAISDGVITVYKGAAEKLINSSDLSATELLAKALANAVGYTDIKSRSLLNSLETYVTVVFECGRPLYSHSNAYGVLRRFVPEDKVDSIDDLSLTADSKGTVFDVSVDIVIGTPGCIKNHIERGNLDFSSLKFRLLDEADGMLRMDFVYDAEIILGKIKDVIYHMLHVADFRFISRGRPPMSQVLLQDQTCVTPNSEQSPLLLEDLILEILSRLPVKTLIRFRAVCKTWKKVISSSYFKRQHFGHEVNRTNLLVCFVGTLFNSASSDPSDYNYYETYVNSISLFPYERLESPLASVELGKELFKEEIMINGIWGPSHGILCVFFNDMIALWNPATRNLWPIPENHLDGSISNAPISFWIDPLTNEFKVFVVLEGWSTDPEGRAKPLFAVYTSCNNSWKEVEAPFYPGDRANRSQCFRYSVSNGMYYFSVYRRGTGDIIFAYDILKEMFQEIQMPKIGVSCDEHTPVLDLFNDSLALFAVDDGDDVLRTEIWVMKEKDCWTKVFNGDIHVDTPGYHRALGFWNQKEIFIYRDSCSSWYYLCELMIYDLVSCKARKIVVEARNPFPMGISGALFFPLSYKESLISFDVNGS